MLKLVPKYQKGKSVWTPQQMQQAIDKKYPQYARIRDNDQKKPLERIYPEFIVAQGLRQIQPSFLKEAWQPIKVAIKRKGFNLSKEYPTVKSGLWEYFKQLQGIVNPFM